MPKGYLQQKRDNHIEFGHHKMADNIAADLRRRHPALNISAPCEWESGRYIAVFVTLVPGVLRMIIQLTDSGRDQHVYNLKPQSDDQTDVDRFVEFMKSYPTIKIRNHGLYAKLPSWERLKLSNHDHDGIDIQVKRALNFFGKTDQTGASE
jgi:hypothetical protein